MGRGAWMGQGLALSPTSPPRPPCRPMRRAGAPLTPRQTRCEPRRAALVVLWHMGAGHDRNPPQNALWREHPKSLAAQGFAGAYHSHSPLSRGRTKINNVYHVGFRSRRRYGACSPTHGGRGPRRVTPIVSCVMQRVAPPSPTSQCPPMPHVALFQENSTSFCFM